MQCSFGKSQKDTNKLLGRRYLFEEKTSVWAAICTEADAKNSALAKQCKVCNYGKTESKHVAAGWQKKLEQCYADL